jgi:very-short-patch-repair endonuclease
MRPETKRARGLRRNMSEPEKILWSRLRRLGDLGFKIRRQAPFRGYCLDFVCYSRRVVIEVDGGQHSDELQADHDLVRDKQLRREGFTVLRFWAGDVRGNLDGVMERIMGTLEASPWAHAETKGWKGDPAEVSLNRASPP